MTASGIGKVRAPFFVEVPGVVEELLVVFPLLNYEYEYDKNKKEFFVRIKYPQTDAGRRVEDRWYSKDGALFAASRFNPSLARSTASSARVAGA